MYPKSIQRMIAAFGILIFICMLLPKNNFESGIPRQTPSSDTLARSFLMDEFGGEYETIMAAALRNDCVQENMLILFAIRKAENGPPGLEFGIMCMAGTDLDTQSGWAAATIMKNRERCDEEDFIAFLGRRYCPLNHEVWIYNIKYWVNKFKEN